jgi:TolB protein
MVGSTSMAAPGAAPSPSGRIAFASFLGDNREIYTVEQDGTGLRRLTRHVRDDYDPAFSPDGRSIAFVRGAARPELFVMRSDGGGVKRLVRWRDGGGFAPAWSPDGSRIVFVSFTNRDPGGQALRTIRPDRTAAVDLSTPNGWFYDSPSWSPDGRSLVFTGDPLGGIDEGNVLRIVAEGGRRPRELIPVGADGSVTQHPAWSPSGDRVSFVRVSDCGGFCDDRNLWTVGPAGDDARELVMNVGDSAWSPDGMHFVVLSYGGFTHKPQRELWELRIVTASGTLERQLPVIARGLYGTLGLSWQPRCMTAGGTRGDRLRGGEDGELVCGFGGPDRLSGGPGRDRLLGGDGNDSIEARGGGVDVVGCGPGTDTAHVDPLDYVGVDCERVTRR